MYLVFAAVPVHSQFCLGPCSLSCV